MKEHYERACISPVAVNGFKARTESYGEPDKIEPVIEFRFDHGNCTQVETITETEARKLVKKLAKLLAA